VVKAEDRVTGNGGVPGEGPYISLTATLEAGLFHHVSCTCNGCATAVKMCDTLSKLVAGRSAEHLQDLNDRDMLVLFPDVPDGKGFYRNLALEAVLSLCRAGNAETKKYVG